MDKINKAVVSLMIIFAFLIPVSLGNLNSGSFVSLAEAKSSKVSKKEKEKRKKDTKKRVKRLGSMGIPKSFYGKSYGSTMSLKEMGNIVAKWIISEYTRTGQIPPLGENNSDWLVLKVNGQCMASDKACARWPDNY